MGLLQNRVVTAIPEELPCRSYCLNFRNVKTEKNNLWTGPKAAFYSKQLCAKIIEKQTL